MHHIAIIAVRMQFTKMTNNTIANPGVYGQNKTTQTMIMDSTHEERAKACELLLCRELVLTKSCLLHQYG